MEQQSFRKHIMQLAVRARALLPKGQSMQEWCRQHCTPLEQKALEEAGLFHEFLASSIYKDDVFEHMHVHIPKLEVHPHKKQRQLLSQHEWRILLGDRGKLVSGSGWEHYTWHHSEPHILLLRRPRSRPEVGGSSPPAESAAGTASSGAGAVGGAAEPAVSAANAAGAAEPAVSAACTAEGELFAFSRSKSIPLDVRLAAKGLSIKLFPHQVPELMAIMQGIQDVHAFAKDLPVQNCIAALTRAAVILQGICGEAGVAWAREQILLNRSGCKDILVEVPAGESKNACLHSEARVFQRLGRELLQAHGRVEAKSASWASHREKRHAKFSGAHFLKALQTPEGSRGAARLSKRLATLMRKCLKVNPRPWTDRNTRELLECSCGNLPLCVEDGVVSFAAWYNSVNAGFTWLIWAQLHGFTPHVPFGDETFAVALLGQRPLARRQLTNAGSLAEITSDKG